MKQAMCIGINDYPGWESDLTQCVSDAKKWGNFLSSIGFNINYIFNNNATVARVTGELQNIIASSNDGDHLVFVYSGHGSYDWDYNNDEADGWDEVLCLYDDDLLDDDFRKILNKIPTGVQMTVVLDCCFGGTGTRAVARHKKKFRPPKKEMPAGAIRRKSFLADEQMPEILLSGCSDDEYSYEDDNGGVFTRVATNILKSSYPMTYNDFKKLIDNKLPTRDYPQTPQLEGSVANKGKTMFAYAEPAPEPEPPTPDPEPEPDTEPWCTCFRAMKKYYLKLKRKFKKR